MFLLKEILLFKCVIGRQFLVEEDHFLYELIAAAAFFGKYL